MQGDLLCWRSWGSWFSTMWPEKGHSITYCNICRTRGTTPLSKRFLGIKVVAALFGESGEREECCCVCKLWMVNGLWNFRSWAFMCKQEASFWMYRGNWDGYSSFVLSYCHHFVDNKSNLWASVSKYHGVVYFNLGYVCSFLI